MHQRLRFRLSFPFRSITFNVFLVDIQVLSISLLVRSGVIKRKGEIDKSEEESEGTIKTIDSSCG
jgi:hypothetical protein